MRGSRNTINSADVVYHVQPTDSSDLGGTLARYPLPGGRVAVATRREIPRAVWVASQLLGTSAYRLIAAGRRPDCALLHRREKAWARKAVSGLRIDLSIRGLEHIDPDERYVIVSLHEGFVDAVALMHLPLNLSWMVRDELKEWRTLGRYLDATDQVVIEPENVNSRDMLGATVDTFARGDNLVVFPQGSILGIEVAFCRGAEWLAEKTGRPILPIVLTGSHRVWEYPFSRLVRFGQSIEMEILRPIRPEDAEDAMDGVQQQMKQIALSRQRVPPRRYVPERDGFWDGYRFDIDPAFPEVAAEVAAHRAIGSSSDSGTR